MNLTSKYALEVAKDFAKDKPIQVDMEYIQKLEKAAQRLVNTWDANQDINNQVLDLKAVLEEGYE